MAIEKQEWGVYVHAGGYQITTLYKGKPSKEADWVATIGNGYMKLAKHICKLHNRSIGVLRKVQTYED